MKLNIKLYTDIITVNKKLTHSFLQVLLCLFYKSSLSFYLFPHAFSKMCHPPRVENLKINGIIGIDDSSIEYSEENESTNTIGYNFVYF